MEKKGGGAMLLLGCIEGEGRRCAHLLLLEGVRRLYGLERLPEMERGIMGKPFFPAYPQIHFNLSHSGPFALCAVGESEVGVDIEAVRPRGLGLPRGILSPAEYAWYESHGGDWGTFCTLWTRKESWVKYTGGTILRRKKALPPLPGEERGGICLKSFAGDGWRAAACCASALPEEIGWLSRAQLEGQEADLHS